MSLCLVSGGLQRYKSHHLHPFVLFNTFCTGWRSGMECVEQNFIFSYFYSKTYSLFFQSFLTVIFETNCSLTDIQPPWWKSIILKWYLGGWQDFIIMIISDEAYAILKIIPNMQIFSHFNYNVWNNHHLPKFRSFPLL